jgi:hypothetical protein
MFDQRVATIASRQQGLISRDQVLQLRGTRDMIRHRVECGRWRVVHSGVFAIAGTPETPEFSLLAGCLALGEGAAASHRTAVALWSGEALGESLELTSSRETGRIASRVTVHRSRDLAPEHVTHRACLPVTTAPRTLVDLGQVAPPWEVNRAVELFLSRRLVTVPALRAAVVLHGRHGRRGVGTLRRILEARALGDEPANSLLEAAMADVCQQGGIPAPVFQHPVVIAGRERFIDFAYPDVLLAIEVDGFEFHSSPSQFEADRVRGNELTMAGWHILHFTWDQVVHRPLYVVATIRRTLQTRTRKKLGR